MFWQQLLNGLTLGSSYALIALGYTMVYGIIQLINFAHGDIFMLGAFVGWFLVSVAGVNIVVALLGAMAFCMLTGMLVERVAYRPLRGKSSRLSPLISAIGVSIFLSTLMVLIASPNARRYPEVIPSHTVSLGSLELSSLQIIILLLSAALMVGLEIMVQKTRMGKAMRACSQDLDAAALMGINVNRIISLTFAVGSAGRRRGSNGRHLLQRGMALYGNHGRDEGILRCGIRWYWIYTRGHAGRIDPGGDGNHGSGLFIVFLQRCYCFRGIDSGFNYPSAGILRTENCKKRCR